MKKTKIFKNIILTTVLFTGMLLTYVNVDAKEVVCNYSFDFTYERTNPVKELSGTADFQLTLADSHIDGYTRWNLKKTGKYSVKTRYGTPAYFKGSSTECPNILVYQRRSGKRNISKFYLHSDYETILKDNPQSAVTLSEGADDLLNACSGKGENDTVLSGYRCGNIIGKISGTKVVTACDEEEIKDILNKKKNLFNTNVAAAYTNEYNRLNNEAVAFTGKTTKAMCEQYDSRWNSNVLKSPLTSFSNASKNMLNDVKCKMDENVRKQLTYYDASGSNPITFDAKAESYKTALLTTFQTNMNKCYNNATDMTEEDKDDAKEDVEDKKEEAEKEMDKYIDNIIDDYLKYVDKITNIDLGSSVSLDCEGLLGDDLLDLINELLGYVQIAAPILLIVLGSIDFTQAVMSDDKDALKKAFSKFVKRAIVCIVIFFIPLILKYLLSFIDGMGTDPLCGIK